MRTDCNHNVSVAKYRIFVSNLSLLRIFAFESMNTEMKYVRTKTLLRMYNRDEVIERVKQLYHVDKFEYTSFSHMSTFLWN